MAFLPAVILSEAACGEVEGSIATNAKCKVQNAKSENGVVVILSEAAYGEVEGSIVTNAKCKMQNWGTGERIRVECQRKISFVVK